MEKVNIKETNLNFGDLSKRTKTNMIVIHHTGQADIDASAEQIHEWHQNQGWSGIGYHFVVRKDGTIERGRPVWAIGAHAQGDNAHTIGIHLSGDFSHAQPTTAQIERTAMLIANLCEDYDIPIDRAHIVGHGELMETECPGANLQALLDDGTITGKANYYRYGAPSENPPSSGDQHEEEVARMRQELDQDDIKKISVLARKYESSGDPACVSPGNGDLGGVSYGLYQLSSAQGSVKEFLAWLCDYPVDELANYGRVLSELEINSEQFKRQWQEIGTIDPGNFGMLQDAYIKERYYGRASDLLCKENYCADKHTTAMRAVILSRTVQNGPSGCVELMQTACEKLEHPNLSYVDDAYFDHDLISAIYDFLIAECDSVRLHGGVWRSANGFCNGSAGVIGGLRNRFVREKAEALAMLTVGGTNK